MKKSLDVSILFMYKKHCSPDKAIRKYMKFFLIAILIFCSSTALAQTKKLRWETELCVFESTYDASKYSLAKLKNTLKLMTENFRLDFDPTPQTFEGVKDLSVVALDREYNLKSGELKNLKIVNSKYFEALRQKKLKELEQTYKLKRITAQAFENPAKIREYTRAGSCVQTYANPLIKGGGDLLEIWLKVNEDSRKRNASPDRLKRIFEQQMNSPDKFEYARIEVMTFGWWNCANNFIEYENSSSDENEKEFKKLFRQTKTIGCDEP